MKWILTLYLLIFFPLSIKTKNYTIVNYKVHYEQPLKKHKIPSNLRSLANFIKEHEGLVLKPYYCPGGLLSIGYGHSIKKGESFTSITESQADSILLSDINLCRSFVKDKFKLEGGKLIAITHFVFAVGSGNLIKSSLYKNLKNGSNIEQSLLVWNKIKGKKSKQLEKQRLWELKQFYNE